MPVIPQLRPSAGHFLLPAWLEQSQGIQAVARRLQCYQHNGFFMAHFWEIKWKRITDDPLALQPRDETTQHDPHPF